MIATLAVIVAASGWSLYAGGGVAMATPSWTGTAAFTEFAEPALVETRIVPRAGAAFEAGLWHAMTTRLGVALTVSRTRQDAAGDFTARLPHPLYVGRPRTATGDVPPAGAHETAVHFGLAWSATRAGLTARLSAGPSYFLSETPLAARVTYEHEYPFDDVRVTSVASSPVRGDAVGGHAALTLERRIAGRVAIAGGGRWSRATLRLARTADGTERSATLRAGGVAASASIRFYF